MEQRSQQLTQMPPKKDQQNHPSSSILNQNATQLASHQMLKVNGDNQRPRLMWGVRIVTILVVVAILVLKLALPPTYIVLDNRKVFKPNPNNNEVCNPSIYDTNNKLLCAQFSLTHPISGLVIKDLNVLNQFALYKMRLVFQLNQSQSIQLDQSVQVQGFQLNVKSDNNTSSQNYNAQLFIKRLIYNITGHYQLKTTVSDPKNNNPSSKSMVQVQYDFSYNRISTRMNQYGITILIMSRFQNTSQLASLISVETIANVVDPRFTNFTIIVRGVYCIISILTAIIFGRRYCQLSPMHRVLQIKFVMFGSFLLILFNDPIYAVTILAVNGFSTFLSSFFTVNMLVFINFIWIFFLRRIFYESQQVQTQLLGCKRSWPFFIMILGLYGSILAMFLVEGYISYQQIPVLVSSKISKNKILPALVISALFLSGSILYQLVMCIRILKKYWWDNLKIEPSQQLDANQLPERHKNFLIFYPFFLIIYILFFSIGGTMPYNYEGPWILYGYSFMNIYIFILQFLYYTPSSQLSKSNDLKQIAEENSIKSDGPTMEFNNQKKQEQKSQQIRV